MLPGGPRREDAANAIQGGIIMNDIIKIETPKQAYQAGRTKYRTGIPCGRGHTGPRYTCSTYCCECQAENARALRERLMGPALVPVTVRVPGNQAQALRDYAALLTGIGGGQYV